MWDLHKDTCLLNECLEVEKETDVLICRHI